VSMVESILKDKKRVIASAIYLQGEYGSAICSSACRACSARRVWKK